MKRNEMNHKKDSRSKIRPLSDSRSLSLCMVLISILLFVPMTAAAGKGRPMVEREKFVLNFNDGYFKAMKGNDNTLYLKKALKRQYPGVDISDYNLDNVIVVAKTKFGKGKAQLRVGPGVTDMYRVSGRPQDFNSKRKNSFDKVRIDNPFHDSWGPWQLKLQGNFIVRKVVLVLEKRIDHYYGWAPHHHPEKPRPQYRHSRPQDGVFYFNMKW